MQRNGSIELAANSDEKGPAWRRFLPIIVIAAGAVTAFILLREVLSFQTLTDNYQSLTAWRDANFALAIAVCMIAYFLIVTFSVPGAGWASIFIGFLFGTVLGTGMVLIAATSGAMAIFTAARTALGDSLRAKAGPWVEKMEDGFRANEVSYLFIMRLVPVMPFFIANLAPAFLGARPLTYLWTTFVGIIPGTIVYVSIGAGLGTQLEAGTAPDLGVIWEWHILGPLLGLAALAALPVLLKKLGLMKGQG